MSIAKINFLFFFLSQFILLTKFIKPIYSEGITSMLKAITQTIKKEKSQLQSICNKLLNYIQFHLAYSVWKIMTYDKDIQFISIGYIFILNDDINVIK